MHEVIALAVPHLEEEDLVRFHKHFKAVFVDDYATVPHQSIRRLLALRRAGKLDILKLGSDYEIETEGVERGAKVHYEGNEIAFDAFIDATGQASLSVRDLPFPSLIEQHILRRARTVEGSPVLGAGTDEASTSTGGIDLDEAFRPIFEDKLCNRLYCAAISFLLNKMPFVQGITSSYEIGRTVSKAIVQHIDAAESGSLFIVKPASSDAV